MDETRTWADQLLPTADSRDPQARAELVWTALVTALDGALVSLEELRGQDEPLWTALTLGTLGLLEIAAGRDDEALGHLNEARDLAERLENAWLAAWSRALLATLAVNHGRLDEARALLDEALALSVGAHSTTSVTLCLGAFARLELVKGDAKRAALLIGAAEGLRRRRGLRAWPILRQTEADLVAQIRPRPFRPGQGATGRAASGPSASSLRACPPIHRSRRIRERAGRRLRSARAPRRYGDR
jgi:ATP/maltotriose-dependent transcriptional regulator MalT